MIFLCTTKWEDDEGSVFRRRHEHDATSAKEARALESAHNETRLDGGMRADGWRYRVTRVRVKP